MAEEEVEFGSGGRSVTSAWRNLCYSDPEFAKKYEGWEEIGQGGYALVVKVKSRTFGRTIALKIITNLSIEAGPRFQREVNVAASVSSKYVVRTFGSFVEGTLAWMEMEYLEGTDLGRALARRRRDGEPFPLPEALDIAIASAQGLADAHEAGLIHRDIKPANIFLPKSRIPPAKILDLGIARHGEWEQFTRTDMILGTPEYASPEAALQRALGPESDVHSLGQVFYELFGKLNKAYPHTTSAQAALGARVKWRTKPLRESNPDVPPALDALVGECLSLKLTGRPSAVEVCERLREIQRSLGAATPRAGAPVSAQTSAQPDPAAATTPAAVAAPAPVAVPAPQQPPPSAAPAEPPAALVAPPPAAAQPSAPVAVSVPAPQPAPPAPPAAAPVAPPPAPPPAPVVMPTTTPSAQPAPGAAATVAPTADGLPAPQPPPPPAAPVAARVAPVVSPPPAAAARPAPVVAPAPSPAPAPKQQPPPSLTAAPAGAAVPASPEPATTATTRLVVTPTAAPAAPPPAEPAPGPAPGPSRTAAGPLPSSPSPTSPPAAAAAPVQPKATAGPSSAPPAPSARTATARTATPPGGTAPQPPAVDVATMRAPSAPTGAHQTVARGTPSGSRKIQVAAAAVMAVGAIAVALMWRSGPAPTASPLPLLTPPPLTTAAPATAAPAPLAPSATPTAMPQAAAPSPSPSPAGGAGSLTVTSSPVQTTLRGRFVRLTIPPNLMGRRLRVLVTGASGKTYSKLVDADAVSLFLPVDDFSPSPPESDALAAARSELVP